jgi:hypothetical protein
MFNAPGLLNYAQPMFGEVEFYKHFNQLMQHKFTSDFAEEIFHEI